MKIKYCLIAGIAAALLVSAINVVSAQSVEITTGPAGTEFTNVVGATTENFDNLATEKNSSGALLNPNYKGTGNYSTLNTAVGTLTASPSSAVINVHSADEYGGGAETLGGSGGSGDYIAIGSEAGGNAAQTATLTFSQGESYVGMWWSACDPGNELFLYSGSTLLIRLDETYLGDLVNHQAAYYGDPNGPEKGQDNGEVFAYLNFYALYGAQITSAVIEENYNVDAAGFEFDNVSVATNYSNPGITGSQIVVPEPAEYTSIITGLLFLTGLTVAKCRFVYHRA